MAMVRYNPFGANELQNDINRLFTNMGESDSSGATATWMPKVDIHEYDNRFQLFVDLPSVDPKEVEITLDNGVLSISGERQDAMSGDEGQVLNRRGEREHGRFYRRFILPETIDTDNVNAKGEDGVLKISIQKQTKAQPRRIEVAASSIKYAGFASLYSGEPANQSGGARDCSLFQTIATRLRCWTG